MTTEWKDCTDPEELFRRKREGWEIEVRAHKTYAWHTWAGGAWDSDWLFRCRPRAQPKKEREELESLRQQLASCQAALADTEALEIGTGERLAKVEQRLAAANGLIAEQNKLGKERQEWALHTNDVIRSLNQQLAEALEQNLVLSKQTDHTILDLSNYVDSLEQQLAAALAACKLKDEALEEAHNGLRWWMDAFPLHVTESDNEEMLKIVKALAIQPDDSALKAWLEMSNTADCRSQSSLQGVVK
jgi:hypothetical protein